MTHTSLAIEPIPAATDEERLRRLRHANAFARLTVGATLVAALYNWWMGNPWVTIGCCLTALGMSCASHLLQRRMLDAGVWLISLTSGAMLFGFTWLGDGLLDSVLLGVPILFVAAAQWLRPKPFLALVACTLLGVVLIGVASHLGWRADPNPGRQILRVVDTLLILSIGGLVVWLLTQEMSERLSTLRRQMEKHRATGKRLSNLTDHDHLTQLPGRKLGAEMLSHALTEAARSQGQMALMAVNVDEFSAINETLGQGGGDILLVHMAARLHALRGAQDVLMRIGADEFLLGLTDVRSAQDAAHVAEAVLSMVSEALEIEGRLLTPTCSIGIAMYPRDGEDFETLVRKATAAVRHAKSAGRNAFRFSTDGEAPSALGHLDDAKRMRHALQNKRFELHYQPVVELESGEWTGVEALLCWPQDDGRVMTAGEFIHTAERSGLIIDLGEWALRQACKQIRRWQIESSNPSLTAAVMVSPVQFRRGNFVEMVRSALLDSALSATSLVLEMAESTVVHDADNFADALQELQDLGVRIAIDDFGTGYSNLRLLQRLNVDTLKIDPSFVRQLTQGVKERALVSAILNAASALGLHCVAKGVGHEATRIELTKLGCTWGQGDLFAEPMPSARLDQAFGRGHDRRASTRPADNVTTMRPPL